MYVSVENVITMETMQESSMPSKGYDKTFLFKKKSKTLEANRLEPRSTNVGFDLASKLLAVL